jgi:hypothetical protein
LPGFSTIRFLFRGLGLRSPIFVVASTDDEEKPADFVNVDYLFETNANVAKEM